MISKIAKRYYTKGLPPFQQPHVANGSSKVAIRDTLGNQTFKDIRDQSSKVSYALRQVLPAQESGNVSFLTSNNSQYIFAQFGIWKSGFSCVPLCNSHPTETLKYYLQDSKASALITSRDHYHKVKGLQVQNLLVLEDLLQNQAPNNEQEQGLSHGDNAMIIYTSGTTGSPKGVVLTLANIISQIECMIGPWGWTEQVSPI